MTHFLSDPWAPHPVVNQHICFGGGGDTAPEVPDYSQYISSMTKIGGELTGYGKDLMEWAKKSGIKLEGIADIVSGRAGEIAGQAAGTYKDMMANWKKTYQPLYQGRAAEAKQMQKDLPGYREQQAGAYGVEVAQAFDASRAAQERALQGYGLKAPGRGLDAMVSNQRGLATVAAKTKGRMDATAETRDFTGKVIQEGLAFPQVAGQSAGIGLAAGNQQIGAPSAAISTTTGANAAGIGAYSAGLPYMKAWGDTMSNSYNQQLAAFNAENQAGGSGVGSMLGTVAGAGIGAYFGGPAGMQAGASIGGSLGGSVDNAATGGIIDGEAGPGRPGDQMVDPGMSASQGAITDDVPARLNVGEFVFPKDVVEWRGESWMQKEIIKARKEREQMTVAAPEEGPASAIDMQPPTFQSQGVPA